MSPKGKDSSKESRIVEAALNLFAYESYHAVSVPTIAEAAGVGIGSIYRMSKSKAGLAERVFDHVTESLIEEVCLPLVVDDGITPDAYFWTYWNRFSEWVRTSPHYLRFLLLYSFVGPQKLTSRLEKVVPLRVILEVAEKRGWLFTWDFRLLISLIAGAVALLVLDCEEGSDLSEANLELLGEAVLRAILNPSEKPS